MENDRLQEIKDRYDKQARQWESVKRDMNEIIVALEDSWVKLEEAEEGSNELAQMVLQLKAELKETSRLLDTEKGYVKHLTSQQDG